MSKIKFFLLLFVIISCQPPAEVNKYTYPTENGLFKNSIDTSLNFEELWKKIIENIGSSYEILSKNKDSGEIIFNFSSNEVSKYIDCGLMNDEIYVDYIHRIFESKLDGQIKIIVILDGQNTTEASVISKFRFVSKETGTTWRFETNKPKSILVGNPAYGADPFRGCQSRNFLEASIIKKITELK